jgi:hypothetical protein
MANPLQIAGAALPPSDFAPLHVNRNATGMWPNTNPLRDASTSAYVEANYGGKRDSYSGGFNCEVSPRLTLIRRPGCSIYNSQTFPAINRFYGWNTFTLTDELVRVMADTGMGGGVVYDATSNSTTPNQKTAIFTKSPGAGTTYFLGVGNTLYMTNGVDNVQLDNETGVVSIWGVDAPTTAPTVAQAARPNPHAPWQPSSGMGAFGLPGMCIVDTNSNIQRVVLLATTGLTEPNPWNATYLQNTADGGVQWQNVGQAAWQANHSGYIVGDPVTGTANTPNGPLSYFFYCVAKTGPSGAGPVAWPSGFGTQVIDGGITWQNFGPQRAWKDFGPIPPATTGTPLLGFQTIVDPNGYLQNVIQAGKTADKPPQNWGTLAGALTSDGTVVWQNVGPFAVAATAPSYYGYAFENSSTVDISNMSPQSQPIVVITGNQITVQGYGTGASGIDTIVLYRTAQGGSTFLYLDEIANPGEGVLWTYVDNTPGSGLNPEIQAQVGGEGTPLPSGATCLAYHLGRIFAAVDNVVYVSSGPDAIASGSSGNAGFDTTFTCQSKIIRFWVNSLGIAVLTLRDAYLIQGSATSSDPLYISTWIENLPLLHYDAFTVLYATAFIFGGQRMVGSLDPGSGITEVSFPLAPLVQQIDPRNAFLTFHTGGSGETALYLSDGATLWYRMAPTSAPEQGSNWSPAAVINGGMSALQSTEILPGEMALLIGPPASTPGPIRMRDLTTLTDAGTPYPVEVDYNPISLANPGQLAGLAWLTLKCSAAGNAPSLGVLLDEIGGEFENVPRTRQDPTNLPPSLTITSNRHSLLQNQKPVWCQLIKFRLQWGATATPDELLTYTIFGQVWQEQRSQ